MRPMNSVLVEYFRFDDLDVGVLSAGKRYILTHKDLAVKEVQTTGGHIELLRKLRDFFRYQSEKPAEEKWAVIKEISAAIKPIFLSLEKYSYSNCQLDVVLNAAELGLLPFELLLDDKDMPYFADPEKQLVLTRRFRHDAVVPVPLPVVPRMLFVYSHGGFSEVPYGDHLYEIEKALAKWCSGDQQKNKVIQVLANPAFEEFSAELKKNDNEDDRYTHVHVLGHGNLIFDKNSPEEFEYGIVFGNNKDVTTPAAAVKELFTSLKHPPFLVNYMICDGANFSNAMKPDKNPVQVTHKAGVPVVLGSQYPLSMGGSTLITRELYAALFRGDDIRSVLGKIRCNLYKKKDESHDWISFVNYLRLPENYNDYLADVSLVWLMQDLKSIKDATESLITKTGFNEDDFLYKIAQLQECKQALEAKFVSIQNEPKYEKEILENLGLLGSVYKRLAELKYIVAAKKGSVLPELIEEQKALLDSSMTYYKRSCDHNLSHHWSIVQFLSISLVLNGNIRQLVDYKVVAKRAIDTAIEHNEKKEWALGSLLELLLLSEKESVPDISTVEQTVQRLIETCREAKESFPIITTRHQLKRYRNWWTKDNGFQVEKEYLVADNQLIDKILLQLEKAM